ncbi:MAG: hypothetical protein AAFX04_01445 [Pseudomonadota bacterium]
MTQSNSDQIMADARNALNNVRYARSIGLKSKALKRKHLWGKIGRVAIATGAVIVGAGIVGAIIGGIGIEGVMITALAVAGASYFFGKYPQMPIPKAEDLFRENLDVLAGKTEIWLEHQRPALPAPAVQLVDGIGVQLDRLAPQLQQLDEKEPAAMEVRKLVGEHLPELINGYKKIPPHLRKEERNGSTPDQQLVDGLGVIRDEIDTVTRQLANGELDKLAVRGRFLELKYQGATDEEPA